jgi:hypothetical protein
MLHEVTRDARSVRLVVVLTLLCVLHACDLALTQSQINRGCFIEANRLAAAVTDSPILLTAYKVGFLGVGVLILYAYRRHWQAELGAWLALTVSFGAMLWWVYYLHYRDVCLANPALAAVALPH